MQRIIFGLILLMAAAPACAQERIMIGDKEALLHVPPGARASLVLVPGKGNIDPRDPLLRNRAALNAKGFATLTVPHDTRLGAAIEHMRKVKEPVLLVGVSLGVTYSARGVGRGAKPDKLVLISGPLTENAKSAQELLKTPTVMPPTLVLHNRDDACDFTPPSAVEPFLKWSEGRASVVWIGGSGTGKDPCGPNSAHGYMGADGQVVDAITSFALR
ncbi:MAG: alpha/beta hydrolase [Reyranellaceae bacterium]